MVASRCCQSIIASSEKQRTIGEPYERLAESANSEEIVQGSLGWRRMRGLGHRHTCSVVDVESRPALCSTGIRCRFVAVCRVVDLHAQ